MDLYQNLHIIVRDFEIEGYVAKPLRSLMIYCEVVRSTPSPKMAKRADCGMKPAYCDEFTACLVKTLQIIEARCAN